MCVKIINSQLKITFVIFAACRHVLVRMRTKLLVAHFFRPWFINKVLCNMYKTTLLKDRPFFYFTVSCLAQKNFLELLSFWNIIFPNSQLFAAFLGQCDLIIKMQGLYIFFLNFCDAWYWRYLRWRLSVLVPPELRNFASLIVKKFCRLNSYACSLQLKLHHHLGPIVE
jgi:hypothetical protein